MNLVSSFPQHNIDDRQLLQGKPVNQKHNQLNLDNQSPKVLLEIHLNLIGHNDDTTKATEQDWTFHSLYVLHLELTILDLKHIVE